MLQVVSDAIRNGDVHAPLTDARSTRVLLEVYPHAALVALFDLPKTLKYKRGPLSRKRAGLARLAEHIACLHAASAPLRPSLNLAALLSTDVNKLRGPALKLHEDTLDAVIARTSRTEVRSGQDPELLNWRQDRIAIDHIPADDERAVRL